MEKCIHCEKELKNRQGLEVHLKSKHSYDKKMVKELYDITYKADGEGICPFSGVDTEFYGLHRGYARFNNKDPKVLKKSLATNSVEYLMKVKKMTEDEAIDYNKNYHLDIKNKNEAIRKLKLKEDPDWTKKQSRYCKEFWINKGYSEDESIKLSNDACAKNRKIFETKLKDNPDEYKNKWESQLQYWLDRGYSLVDAKVKLKERQRTFTLDKLIEKYGKEDGEKRWRDRHDKWSKEMIHKYKRGDYVKGVGYSKKSIEFFELLIDSISKNHILYKDNEMALRDSDGNVYRYDFTHVLNKKIIEYNGTYWHCKPGLYESEYIHAFMKIKAKDIWDRDDHKKGLAESQGYDVLVIWEDEVDSDLKSVLKKCIEFITK